MPLLDGIAAAQQIKQSCPDIKIIFVSVHSEEAYMKAAFDAGGDKYILKKSLERDLVQSVEEIFAAT